MGNARAIIPSAQVAAFRAIRPPHVILSEAKNLAASATLRRGWTTPAIIPSAQVAAFRAIRPLHVILSEAKNLAAPATLRRGWATPAPSFRARR